MRWALYVAAMVLTVAGALPALAEVARVTGTASYRERIALPPGAIFEAVLEDVSLADVPAQVLGRTTIPEPGNPPFAFKIDYDPADVRPERSYAVRTQVSVGPRLMFISDTSNPVLTRGAPSEVEVWMIKVGDTAKEAGSPPVTIGAHGLRLPASFMGEMPCADCPAIDFHLNLWPDQVFHLRRTWEDKDARRDTIGRWSVDAERHVLGLRGADEELTFQILGPNRLQLIARDEGATAAPEGQNVLTADEEFESFEPHLPLRGMLNYEVDSARFTECLTGRDYPLVKDGDYEALEHAYLAAGAEAGGPIMASFDGGIVEEPEATGGGTERAVLVERFVGVWPGETCERAMGEASLTNTYWKILRLGDTEIAATEGKREPNLILREGDPRFSATVGCNQLVGAYTLDDERLAFGRVAATMMACPDPLAEWERKLIEVLQSAAAWRLDGQTLELLDAEGGPLALLQAVYLY